MDRGSFIHKLLAEYYTLKKDKSFDGSQVVDLINKHRADVLLETSLPSDKIENAIKAFAQYLLFHKDESWEIIGVEEPFSKILYEGSELRIILEGKIDLIVKDNSGKIFPVDHKSVDRETYPTSLKNQFIAYAWALDTNTLIENRIGMQKTKPPEEKFLRHIHNYSSDQINEWIEDAVYAVMRMHAAMQTEVYPGSFSHCWSCFYKDICSTERQDREKVIDRDWARGEGSELYVND
jgi:CRISPR/Cas system-associated exonuclease Cas4 (RecB family)